ncbi:MAG TPA: heparinase II/III family protein, partial [Planctomycetota bacterium]|nr:heparinase II/III family protein [Planctomycetota bacterium]
MKRLPLRFAVSATCAMAALSVGASAFGAMLDGLRKEHPRVLLTDDRLQELKRLAGEDAALKTAADGIITLAGLYLDKPPVTDSTDWNQWRETTARTFATAFAWRWTGDEKYLKMARETLLTAAAFDDWYEKRQFLDTSEMTLALAVGYDWLYPALADADREVIRTAIIEKGLKNGLKDYAGGSQRSWWIASNHNWNLVCNAGMVVGALAVAESDSQTAAAVLEAAVKSMPFALESYKPDGAWMEGPYYWEFATRYAVMALASLQTALGSDFGLSENPGLARTWRFGAYVTGPNGLTVMAFADSLEHHWSLPFAFWAATRYNDPLAAQYEMQYFGKPHPWWADPAKEVDDPRHAPNRVLDVVWYSPPPDGTPTLKDALPLNTVLRGKVELASFRSAWDDPKALWVTVKAGPNGGLVNHGQCDAGSFELHAGGVRWAFDPGRAGYGAGYFDVGSADKPGARWGYAKAAARGHNVLLLDNANQDPFAEAPITKFIDTEAVAAAVVDLSGVYRGYATSASRGVQMLNRQCVVVQDELELDQPREVTWGMN